MPRFILIGDQPPAQPATPETPVLDTPTEA